MRIWSPALIAAIAMTSACGPAENSASAGVIGDAAAATEVTAPEVSVASGSAGEQDAVGSRERQIAEDLLRDPSAHPPVSYVYVTSYLWNRGDRLQAAFWHYMFQIRTAPWLKHDRNLGPLRGAVNESIGGTINRWVGSDYAAWEDVTRRAIAFEQRMPLNAERPAGLTEAQWRTEVEESRRAWVADFETMFGPGGPGRASVEAQRRSNGLPVGPLESPGAPLPADWR